MYNTGRAYLLTSVVVCYNNEWVIFDTNRPVKWRGRFRMAARSPLLNGNFRAVGGGEERFGFRVEWKKGRALLYDTKYRFYSSWEKKKLDQHRALSVRSASWTIWSHNQRRSWKMIWHQKRNIHRRRGTSRFVFLSSSSSDLMTVNCNSFFFFPGQSRQTTLVYSTLNPEKCSDLFEFLSQKWLDFDCYYYPVLAVILFRRAGVPVGASDKFINGSLLIGCSIIEKIRRRRIFFSFLCVKIKMREEVISEMTFWHRSQKPANPLV